MFTRREWLGTSLGAGASLTLSPALLRALEQAAALGQPGGRLIQRVIPSSGERLPVISFAPRPTVRVSGPGEPKPAPTDIPAAKEVLSAFLANGGTVVDVLHGGPIGENAARAAAAELGIQDKLFWTTTVQVNVPVLPGYAGPPVRPGAAAIRAAMDEKFSAFKVPKIDLVMVGTLGDTAGHLAVLRELKKAGRVRYIGVHHLAWPANASRAPFAELEAIMRNEEIDFIGTDYSAGDRRAEETILPLAQERKIGVMAYFPFDRRRIFERASATPLPEWAAEFDAKTWAQFFLKYVVSHPAVTVVRTGTTRAAHMQENIGDGVGRLPDAAMRTRMAALVDTFPPTPVPTPQTITMRPPQQGAPAAPAAPLLLSAEILDRHAGEYVYSAVGQAVTFRRDGDGLRMKIAGNMPEGPLVARSETRFQGPVGLVIEFQRNAQGATTGAIVEQGPYRIPLDRK